LESSYFDQDYINMNGEAYLIIPADNQYGELSVGLLTAGLELSYAPGAVFFKWYGMDENDESTGQGVLEWDGEGLADLELEYSFGDIADFTATKVAE